MKKQVVKHIRYSVVLLAFTLFVSCSKSDLDEPVSIYRRTVLAYMAADNNLNPISEKNITQMMDGLPTGADLVVYVDGYNTPPQIIHLSRRCGSRATREVVRTYQEHNSASPEIFASVIGDMKQMFPAQSYGLILWSHGTGWLPAASVRSRAFGVDGTAWMEIDELSAALPDGGFDFILFDACYMASVEVAYELRNKSKYIIASAAEIIEDGFPYSKATPHFFGAGQITMEKICNSYFNHYNSLVGAYRSATVSLIRTDGIDELARLVRNRTAKPASSLQYFDRNRTNYMFDMAQAYSLTDADMGQCVVWRKATPYMFEGVIRGFAVQTHCGLTTYIEGQSEQLDQAIKNTQWYRSIHNK